jgi:hypothetical protein
VNITELNKYTQHNRNQALKNFQSKTADDAKVLLASLSQLFVISFYLSVCGMSYKFPNHISIMHTSLSLLTLKEVMNYLNLSKSTGNLVHQQV